MKSSFTFIKKEKNEVTFKMEIKALKFEEAIQKAYEKNKNKYAIDGFRKGKAPRKILEMKFGEDIFYEDAINILFPDEYTEAVEELKLEPIDRPVIDITEIGKGKNLVIEVEVTVEPEVELGDYKGIEAKKVEYNVTDEDVDNELLAMQDRNARLVNVDRGIVEGDSVLMDFEGYVDGEQIEGGTAENQRLLIGSGNFISGFEDQLIGHKAGEEVEVNVTFPEDYSPELSGKAAVFKVNIKEVQEKKLPEIDDEFAKDVSEFDTLEELKKDILEKKIKSTKEKSELEQKEAVLEKILEVTKVEIPDIMIENKIDDLVRELDFQLKYSGLEMNTYLQYMNKDMGMLREELKENAVKQIKTRLAVEAIEKVENIDVNDEDIEKEIERVANEYKTDAEEFKQSLKPENYEYMKRQLRYNKTIDFLVDNAKLS